MQRARAQHTRTTYAPAHNDERTHARTRTTERNTTAAAAPQRERRRQQRHACSRGNGTRTTDCDRVYAHRRTPTHVHTRQHTHIHTSARRRLCVPVRICGRRRCRLRHTRFLSVSPAAAAVSSKFKGQFYSAS